MSVNLTMDECVLQMLKWTGSLDLTPSTAWCVWSIIAKSLKSLCPLIHLPTPWLCTMVAAAAAVDAAGYWSTNTIRSEAASRRFHCQQLRAWHDKCQQLRGDVDSSTDIDKVCICYGLTQTARFVE